MTEVLGFECSGDGEHDFLYVEKTQTNTEWLSRQLAAFAGVAAKDAGYSGLKDRHAVTRQWFSVPRWNRPDWTDFELDNVTILDVERNNKKLRRGAHRSNQFQIVLRNLGSDPVLTEPLLARLRRIQVEGVPNYFGEQRFGRNAANIDLADAWSAGRRLSRQKRSIAISTARSFLFNELLAARVRDASWNILQDGDVANLDGTGSVFDVKVVDDELRRRCSVLDIHPATVLWGDETPLEFAPAGYERWIAALQRARVKSAQRSLRLRVQDIKWSFDKADLTLNFALVRGAFATSVLREVATVCSDR